MLTFIVGLIVSVIILLILCLKKFLGKKAFIITSSIILLIVLILSILRADKKVNLLQDQTYFHMTVPELVLLNGRPTDGDYFFDEARLDYTDEYEGYDMQVEYQFRRYMGLLLLDRINYNIQIDNSQEALTLMEDVYNMFEKSLMEKVTALSMKYMK